MLMEADIAPNVSFVLADGSASSVSAFAGKPLVLYFYPKDDTSGCTKEAQEFSALAAEFAKHDAAVVGISKDSVKSHAKFITKYALGVQLGSDEPGAVCEAFGVWVEKSMYGKTYMGTARTTFVIDEQGVILDIISKVDTKNHTVQILS